MAALTKEAKEVLEGLEHKWVRLTRNAFERIANREGLTSGYFVSEYERSASSISFNEFLKRIEEHNLQLTTKNGELEFLSLDKRS